MSKNENKNFYSINSEIMPTVDEIEKKMNMLAEKYNFSFDFGFPKITEDDLINGPGDPPNFNDF